jgi:putative tricarboxylic transport membrane protein
VKKADIIAGIVVLLFSGFVIEESLRIPTEAVAAGHTNFAPAPGFLPLWAGIVLAALSMALIVGAALRSSPGEQKGAIFPVGPALVSVSLLAGSLAVYIALLEMLGYLFDTFLLNAFLLRVVMRGGWIMSVAVAVAASIALYVIFRLLLGIDLPQSPLGF